VREVIFIDEDRLQGSRFETVKKTGYVIFLYRYGARVICGNHSYKRHRYDGEVSNMNLTSLVSIPAETRCNRIICM
jgi:hypothetical protein